MQVIKTNSETQKGKQTKLSNQITCDNVNEKRWDLSKKLSGSVVQQERKNESKKYKKQKNPKKLPDISRP